MKWNIPREALACGEAGHSALLAPSCAELVALLRVPGAVPLRERLRVIVSVSLALSTAFGTQLCSINMCEIRKEKRKTG